MPSEIKQAVPGEAYPIEQRPLESDARNELIGALKLTALGTSGSYIGAVNCLFEAVIGLYCDLSGAKQDLRIVADGLEKTAANFARYLRDRQTLVEMPVKGLKPN